MATEVAPMDAQATSASSDSPQKLLENAVETIGDAVGSPLSSRAKEGDNALETLVDVAAAGERPEDTVELLKQEPSSLATNEEDMEIIEEEKEGASSSSSQDQEQDPSSNAQLKTTPEKPKPASKNSPPPLSSSSKDGLSTAATDEEEMDTSDLPSGQEVYASPLSSPQKGSSRNQKYSMRTRRASCMDPSNTSDSDPTGSKQKSHDVTPAAKQPSLSPPSSPAHSDSEPEERKTDMPKRGKGRGKTRGRGLGRGILKKTQSSNEPSTRGKQAEVTATSRGRGRGRGRGSSTQAQSPMTRAAAAGLQVVQFLSLPRKRSKKRQGEDEGTEEDDYEDEEEEEDYEEDDSPVKPHSKKPKLEEQCDETETAKTSKPADAQSGKGKLSKQKSKEPDTSSMDSTLEEEKDTNEVEQDDKALKSPSKPVSRRGGRRGRRGRGAMAGTSRGSRLDTTPPEKSADKDDVVEITEAKKNSPMQPPTRGKRRGRPPKKKPEPDVTKSKTKEDSEDTAPVTDKTSRDSQEEETCEEMEEDQAKESTETAEPSTAAASGDKKEQENASQDESADNDAVIVKVEKESEEKTSVAPASSGPKAMSAAENPVKTSSVIVSVLSGSKTSTEASKQSHVPTHSSAGEGHFPYHPFPPIDEMHPMPPHPFISGYPPFSAPYGPFLVPSSPSYPYPPPDHYHMYTGYQEDMSYHGFPHPRAHPASLPPQPASTSTTASSSTTSSTTSSNTTSTPAQKSESSGNGGEQPPKTSPSTPSIPPPGPSPTTPHAMEMPMCHYAPHPPAGYLPSYVIPMEWGVPPHSAQRPPMMPSPTTIKPTAGTSEPRFPLNLFHDDQRSNQPVDCPECGRHFKNNKALNGHMRLHGGFDWTRKPYQAIQQMQQQQQQKDQQQQQAKEQPKASSPTPPSDNFVREQLKQHVRDKHSNEDGKQGDEPARKKEKKVPSTSSKNSSSSRKYSKEKNSFLQREEEKNLHSRIGPTLDDLCRAAAELERIDSRNGMKEISSAASKKHRPGNISIPSHSSPLLHHHDRQKLTSFSPPYTPPPILSPSRSMTMLSNITSGGPATPQVLPCTPNKIWQRKGSERVSESEDSFSYAEPKINVGKEFQAELPKCSPDESPADTIHKATRVWKPLLDLTQEEEDTVDGFLELACSPVMPHAGRNKEFALHTLYQTKGSVKEAVRLLVTGKSAISRDDPMATYNYTGSKRWTGRERQQFRHAYRVHHKHFALVRSALENKQLAEVVEYYYSWKKYCNDEYRGRNRHISEEILSEEDETSVRPPSAASSSGSSASGDLDPHSTNPARYLTSGRSLHNSAGSLPHEIMEHLPRSYVPPHLLNNPPIQEHHCKYPGCNQVYTSIFALNGHIRVHGGSWYPKKNDVENGPESSGPLPAPAIMGYPSSSLFGSSVAPHRSRLEDRHTSHQLEVAKTMVMDLPQPRSPAHSLAAHTPSPKPSPGRARSSLVRSRKANSSSPADRDGFYPCNRCGRVFTKVKSRSAHMKSHIVKQS